MCSLVLSRTGAMVRHQTPTQTASDQHTKNDDDVRFFLIYCPDCLTVCTKLPLKSVFFFFATLFLAPLWCSRHLGPCLRFSCISRYTTGASPMDHACIDPSYIGLCHVRQSSRLELQGTNFRILQYSIDHISPPLAQYTPNARSGWKLCNTNYSVTYASQMPPNWYWT